MNINRIREIEKLISPEEALDYALVKNNIFAIVEAIREHDLTQHFDPEDPEPEDALAFAIDKLPANVLTTLLKEHGYQPIPTAKQAKRDKALSH
jgi:hypothetical protein